jgi:hypothetical protein
MYDRQQAYEFLHRDEFEISVLHHVSYIDLSPLTEVSAPGVYYPLEHVMAMLKRIFKQLNNTVPSPKEQFCVAISNDLRNIALVKTPGLQKNLSLTPPSPDADSLQNENQEGMRRILDAASLTQKITDALETGDIAYAEDLDALISSSPTPEIIRRHLKERGHERKEYIADHQKFVMGGGKPFPTTLPSQGIFSATMRIETGVDEKEGSTFVQVSNLQHLDNSVTTKRPHNTLIKLNFQDKQDGKALIAAQLAEHLINAEVCVAIDSFTGKISELTLCTILNHDDIFAKVDKMYQHSFNFGQSSDI